MLRRLKIKVVCGSWGDHVSLHIWGELAKSHEIELLILSSDEISKVKSSVPMVVFPELTDMPGYYRDLENYLKGCDLVISLEWARLSTFQALRATTNLGLPCMVVVHEFETSLNTAHSNVQAIKFDIATNASHFFVSSKRALRILSREGVEAGRMSIFKVPFDMQRDRFKENLRTKFRAYIGVKENDFLVVGRCSFQNSIFTKSLMMGFKQVLISEKDNNAAPRKLLIIGEGESSEELKYFAADIGIGSKTIFLCQDPNPFWVDVLSAADVVLFDKSIQQSGTETFPFSFSQAAASGVPCIVPAGGVYEDVESKNSSILRLFDFTPHDLTEALMKFGTDLGKRESRCSALDHENQHTVSEMLLSFEAVFNKVSTETSGSFWADRVRCLLQDLDDSQYSKSFHEKLVLVEELLLNRSGEAELIAELWRVKGELFGARHDTGSAIAAFEKAIQINSKCFKALRGLGFLALESHSHEDSIVFFRRALCVAQNDYQTMVGIGLIYRRLKMLDEAVFWLEKAADIGGPESTAVSLIVQACLESPDSRRSLITLESLRESFGDIRIILTGLNQIYLAQGIPTSITLANNDNCA